LELYQQPDGWTASAKRVLAEMRSSEVGPCDAPLTVDPEGRAIYRAGCLER
jgi:hypothetical protein